MVKSRAWDADLLEGGLGMCLNLGCLASDAFSGPDSYLFPQVVPYEVTGDQFPCGTYGEMCLTLD